MTNIEFSVVVPVMDESGNIRPMVDAVAAAMTGHSYELIFVDDASVDQTHDEIQAAKKSNPNVRLLRHAENRGQSRALLTGIRAANAPFIITCDGDMQNPPSEMPKLIEAMDGDTTVVCGIRTARQDTESKRMASLYANKIRQAILRDDCPDTGCALKLFPRDVFLRLPYFDHMHRYLPVLFRMYGLRLKYVNVQHMPRTIGVSKYNNLQRALVGIYDLIGVRWLQSRTHLIKVWEE